MLEKIKEQFPSNLFGERPGRTVVRLVIVFTLFFALLNFIIKPTIVDGVSMDPTLRHGEFILVNRLAYWRREPERGDIVLVRENSRSLLIKRLVGLPGERIAIVDGELIVDGRPLPEPYVEHNARWNYLPATLDANEYLIVGDNRGIEQVFGKVTRDRIIGRPLHFFTEE